MIYKLVKKWRKDRDLHDITLQSCSNPSFEMSEI